MVMFFISAIQTSLLKQLIIPTFVMIFILLILVPIIGLEVKGAKRWLDLKFFRLQPIELLKPLFVLITAKILTYKNINHSQIKYFFSFLLLVSIIILLIDQPDLGQSILIIGSWIAMVFVSGVNIVYIFSFLIIFISFVAGILFLMPEKFDISLIDLLLFSILLKETIFSLLRPWTQSNKAGLKDKEWVKVY